MLLLSEIWIYPVKSLGGISLSQAQLTDRGLEHDRRWLLVDENGMFLSQREHAVLALFQPEMRTSGMLVASLPKKRRKQKLIKKYDWIIYKLGF